MTTVQLEATTSLFNAMSKMCFRKCVPNFHEEELNVAEFTCIDRCTAKYMQCNMSVSKILNEFQKQEMINQGQTPPAALG